MGKVFALTVVGGATLGVYIVISSPSQFSKMQPPLRPIPTVTITQTPTPIPLPTNPGGVVDCWNEAAGPGCPVKSIHPRGPGECDANNDNCPWHEGIIPTPDYSKLFPPTLPVPCPACGGTPTPTPWPGQHYGEEIV
jgi:hypothetical protein